MLHCVITITACDCALLGRELTQLYLQPPA